MDDANDISRASDAPRIPHVTRRTLERRAAREVTTVRRTATRVPERKSPRLEPTAEEAPASAATERAETALWAAIGRVRGLWHGKKAEPSSNAWLMNLGSRTTLRAWMIRGSKPVARCLVFMLAGYGMAERMVRIRSFFFFRKSRGGFGVLPADTLVALRVKFPVLYK